MDKETVEQAGKRLGFSKPDYVEFDGHQNEGFYFDIFKKGWDAAMEQSATDAIEFAGWVTQWPYRYLLGKSYKELYELWKKKDI